MMLMIKKVMNLIINKKKNYQKVQINFQMQMRKIKMKIIII